MDFEENVRIVRTVLDRWLQADVLGFFADDFEYVLESDPRSFPWARSYQKAEMAELLQRSAVRQKNHKITPRAITAAGDTVLEEQMSALVGDTPITSRSCAVFEWSDGRVGKSASTSTRPTP